tara:strand:+ start:1875 stop:2453 length:579 start_codon:yes stop_codon:yes gene_type:complete
MITKNELNDLYEWGITTIIGDTLSRKNEYTGHQNKKEISKLDTKPFSEKKADKYIGRYRDFGTYMVTGNWLKMRRKLTTIRRSAMPDHIYKIHQNPEILYSGYANLNPGYYIKPHQDPDVYIEQYKRIQIPLYIPEPEKAYMTWDDGIKYYWKEGEPQVWYVMDHLHSGNNESNKSAKFLFLDVIKETQVEL